MKTIGASEEQLKEEKERIDNLKKQNELIEKTIQELPKTEKRTEKTKNKFFFIEISEYERIYEVINLILITMY